MLLCLLPIALLPMGFVSAQYRQKFAHVTISTLSFPMINGQSQCFFETLENGYLTTITAHPIGKESLEAAMEVKNPRGVVLFPKTWNTSLKFQFNVEEDGDYSMCFTSPMGISVPSRLTLFLAAYHKEKVQQLIQAYANRSQDSDVRTSISIAYEKVFENLGKTISLITDGRKFIYSDYLLLSANSRYVNVWSCAQSAVIIISGCVQVFLIRRFFKTATVTKSGKPRC